MSRRLIVLALAATLVAAAAAPANAQLTIGGTTYTKFLWGTDRNQGSLYNFTTVPEEGYGDNGQGSEVELLLSARLGRKVEVRGRLHSRFNQNFWTNFGGWGGRNPSGSADRLGPCIAGECGEFDPRSNQYVKLRGVAVTLTPGYRWLDSATLGANDFGQFDPFVIGRIRYIDRDNASGMLFQGSSAARKVTWDAVRISLPKLWAGPNFMTGRFHAADAAYGGQIRVAPNAKFDVGWIGQYVNDIEIDPADGNLDDGRDMTMRFRNAVVGVKASARPTSTVNLTGQWYYSDSQSFDEFAPPGFGWTSGFSPVLAGEHDDHTWKANASVSDLGATGFTLNAEVFSIGAEYVSMMAARRESDVLLTEGHDSTWAFPGPANAAFGVFPGNPTRIGYGGWDGNAQQVATINVDNEFSDFDEPMAETAIGWKGITLAPIYSRGALELKGEYSYIDYNTNWQAFGDDTLPVNTTTFPVHEADTGVGHNFRSAYAPFQDKTTHIFVAGANYSLNVGRGVDFFGKFKVVDEEDLRLNEARFLPYVVGDCTGGPCRGRVNEYSPGNSTSVIYSNPSLINVGNTTGYQWKPFDDISDDDRDLDYKLMQVGVGSQLTNDLHGTFVYERYKVTLQDGNSAFQAYNLHEMASGDHEKNRVILKGRYVLQGMEFGVQYEYNFGTFDPDFGSGFVPQIADDTIAAEHHVAAGSRGFTGRFGGWNSLESRDFDQYRLKAFIKVQF
jgi:hypothetical protein